MKKNVLSLLTVFLLCATLAGSKEKNPHQFDTSQCGLCHTASQPIKEIKRGSATDKCLSCHPNLFQEGYMHPVDIRPNKVRVPADFLLSSEGTITCNTCHDVHAAAESPMGGKSKFLRRFERGKDFCDICHKGPQSQAASHQQLFNTAHYTIKEHHDNEGQQPIDAMSRDCISCHDGSIGSAVELKAGSWQHSNNFLKFDKGGMHPIGMNYEKSRLQNPKSMLKPLTMVDKRIRFFNNGCLGCGSCHDPYSNERMQLIIKDTGSALCFSCHKMNG